MSGILAPFVLCVYVSLLLDFFFLNRTSIYSICDKFMMKEG